MKKLFFILTFCILFAKTDQVFANTPCDSLNVNPIINFSTSYGKLVYDFSKNQEELTALGKQYGILEKGLFASGLSIIGVDWELSVNTTSKIINEDTICIIPETIDVFVGYSKPIIYISKDLQPNSCEYNVVMRHEQTHQQINQTALEYFAPLLKKAVQNISCDIPSHYVDSISKIDAATKVITEKYIRKIEPVIDNFKKEILSEQAKLDNHSNYKLEGELCKKVNNF